MNDQPIKGSVLPWLLRLLKSLGEERGHNISKVQIWNFQSTVSINWISSSHMPVDTIPEQKVPGTEHGRQDLPFQKLCLFSFSKAHSSIVFTTLSWILFSASLLRTGMKLTSSEISWIPSGSLFIYPGYIGQFPGLWHRDCFKGRLTCFCKRISNFTSAFLKNSWANATWARGFVVFINVSVHSRTSFSSLLFDSVLLSPSPGCPVQVSALWLQESKNSFIQLSATSKSKPPSYSLIV